MNEKPLEYDVPVQQSSKLEYDFNPEQLASLEWGSEFSDFNWSQVEDKILMINTDTNTKKPWRIPTVEELIFAYENKVDGFDRGGGATYWCADIPKYKNKDEFNKKSQENSIKFNQAYYINMFNGGLFPGDKERTSRLRLVR